MAVGVTCLRAWGGTGVVTDLLTVVMGRTESAHEEHNLMEVTDGDI